MKRSFTEEDLKLICFGDKDGFVAIKETHTDSSRWHQHYELIFKEESSGKLYKLYYCRGSTESQDEGPEFSGTDLPEVEAFTETVTSYREVKP